MKLPDMIVLGRNNSKMPVSRKNKEKVLVFKKNKGNNKVVKFGVDDNNDKSPHY